LTQCARHCSPMRPGICSLIPPLASAQARLRARTLPTEVGQGKPRPRGTVRGALAGLRRTFDAVRLEQRHFQQTDSMEILVLEGPLAARGPAWPAGRSLA
jgi:hypothetical protein